MHVLCDTAIHIHIWVQCSREVNCAVRLKRVNVYVFNVHKCSNSKLFRATEKLLGCCWTSIDSNAFFNLSTLQSPVWNAFQWFYSKWILIHHHIFSIFSTPLGHMPWLENGLSLGARSNSYRIYLCENACYFQLFE